MGMRVTVALKPRALMMALATSDSCACRQGLMLVKMHGVRWSESSALDSQCQDDKVADGSSLT